MSLGEEMGLILEEHKQHLKEEFVGAVPEELFVQQVVLAQKSPSMYV